MLHAALHAGSDDDIAAAESLPGFWERYRYNIRFSKDQLDRDIPQGIFAAQGVGGVWYGGGALSHWNIADILWQSSQVVERMARDTGPRSKKHRWAFVPVAQRVTEEKVSTALSKAFLGTAVPEYFYGTYNFVGHPLMVSAVVSRVEGDEAAVMASLPKHYLGGGEVVGVGVIRKKDIVPSPAGVAVVAGLLDEEGYYLALHSGGVVRFHAIAQSDHSKRILLFIHSKGEADAALNVGHVIRFGCFCFGTLKNDGSVVTIQRYNRWHEDVDPIYVMQKLVVDRSSRSGHKASLTVNRSSRSEPKASFTVASILFVSVYYFLAV